jgi:hypothetical protein
METKPEDNGLFDEVFAIGRMQDNDPVIYHDLTLSQAEAVERQLSKRALPGGSSRYLNSFEDWFFEHCMKRELRPVEALEIFLTSKSSSIRAIAAKAMRDRYGVIQSDKLTEKLIKLTEKTTASNESIALSTKWIMISTILTMLISLIALLSSCKPTKSSSAYYRKECPVIFASLSFNDASR